MRNKSQRGLYNNVLCGYGLRCALFLVYIYFLAVWMVSIVIQAWIRLLLHADDITIYIFGNDIINLINTVNVELVIINIWFIYNLVYLLTYINQVLLFSTPLKNLHSLTLQLLLIMFL